MPAPAWCTASCRASPPQQALDFWADRLAGEGVESVRDGDRLRFADPEGLGHELAVDPGAKLLSAEHPEIPPEHALGGVIGVRAHSLRPEASARLLADVLEAAPAGDGAWELRGEERAATITFDPSDTPGHPRRRAPSITSRGVPRPPSTRAGSSAWPSAASARRP